MSEQKLFPDNSFDVIICHNILEYAQGQIEFLNEFYRLLKRDGTLSIVNHNKNGGVIEKIYGIRTFFTLQNNDIQMKHCILSESCTADATVCKLSSESRKKTKKSIHLS